MSPGPLRPRRRHWLEGDLEEAAATGALADSGSTLDGRPDRLPVVRASKLRELLTGGSARAVVLRGARVTGDLNLHSAEVRCPLVLQGCAIEGAVNLSQAETREIQITGCLLTYLSAEQATVKGNLWLDGSELTLLSLAAAHVEGQLSLNSVKLGSAGYPPNLGAAELVPADTADPPSLPEMALMADQVEVDQGVYCRGGFRAKGHVRFLACVISGQLDLTGAKLLRGLNIDRAQIAGHLSLTGARIRPSPRALGAEQLALSGRQATIRQGMRARRVQAGILDVVGGVRLKAAEVPGGITIEGALLVGGLGVVGARLGELELRSCTLKNQDGPALDAAYVRVDRHVHCDTGFRATGAVSLVGARVEGSVKLTGDEFSNPGGTALDLRDARIGERLDLRPTARPEGDVDLTHAQVAELADDATVWPAKPSAIRLHGFEYADLDAPDDVDYKKRIKWLERDSQRGPDEYGQLAAYYRRCSNAKSARKVLMAGERHRRDTMNPLRGFGNWLLEWTVGYGYEPQRALGLLAILLVAGAMFFDAHRDEFAKLEKPAQAVDFSPVLYTLDTLVPVLEFRQESTHRAKEGPARTAHAALTILGWAITTAVVAGVTSVLIRRE